MSFTDNLFLRDDEPDGQGERFANLAQFWNIEGLTVEHNTIWDGKGIVLVAEGAQNSPSAMIDHNLFCCFSVSKPIGATYTITDSYNIFGEAPSGLSKSTTDSVNSKPQFDGTATDDYRLPATPTASASTGALQGSSTVRSTELKRNTSPRGRSRATAPAVR